MQFPALLASLLFAVTGVCSSLPGRSAPPYPRDASEPYPGTTYPRTNNLVAPDTSIPGTVLNDSALFKNITHPPPLSLYVLPSTLSYCNDSSDTIDHQLVSDIIAGEIAQSTANEIIDAGAALIWGSHFPNKGPGTQWYICNYNNEYAVAHNLKQVNIVNDMLDSKCGDAGGWLYFYDWNIWFGRDKVNDDGSFRPICQRTPSGAS